MDRIFVSSVKISSTSKPLYLGFIIKEKAIYPQSFFVGDKIEFVDANFSVQEIFAGLTELLKDGQEAAKLLGIDDEPNQPII